MCLSGHRLNWSIYSVNLHYTANIGVFTLQKKKPIIFQTDISRLMITCIRFITLWICEILEQDGNIFSLSPHNLKDLSFRQLYPGINQEILITETGIVPRGYTQGCRDNFIGNSSNSAAAVSWSLILQTETESGRKLFQLQFLVQFYLSR